MKERSIIVAVLGLAILCMGATTLVNLAFQVTGILPAANFTVATTCPTCVVASSPGVGIAHFAGLTQTVTSSAVNLAGADVTGVLPSANLPTSPAYMSGCCGWTFAAFNIAANKVLLQGLLVTSPVTFSNITFNVQTADNSANVYDAGLYGPNCRAGATSIALVAHIGAASYTTTGYKTAAVSGGSKTITPGWYCLAWTGNASILNIGYFSNAAALTDFGTTNDGAGATSGGALASTITAPASAGLQERQNVFFMAIY